MNAIKLYKAANYLYKKRISILQKLIKGVIFLLFNSTIPYECSIVECSIVE